MTNLALINIALCLALCFTCVAAFIYRARSLDFKYSYQSRLDNYGEWIWFAFVSIILIVVLVVINCLQH